MIFFVLVSSLIYLFHLCVFSFLFVIHFISSLFLGYLLFSNVDLAMGVIEITDGDESFRPAWR